MKNLILIFALLALTRTNVAQIYAPNTTACDQTVSMYYNNGCVSSTCFSDVLFRMQQKIGFGNEQYGNVGVLGQGFTYQILPMNGSAGTYFTVNIRYADNSTNQILSDPVGCINYHIYSTVNSYSQNASRQAPSIVGVVTDGFTPSWPLSQYSYDPQIGAALSFNMTTSQMGQYCLTLNATAGNIEYDCFFEVAFQVRGITQASYYFEIQVFLNTVTNSVPTTKFVQQTQVATCVLSGVKQCQANITVASTFQFCDDYACQNPQNFPVATLFLNNVFFMKFAISDSGFSQLFIRNPQISFNSYQFQSVNTASQLTYNNINPGYIIFNLTVPIVINDLQIRVTGQLNPSKSRRMMQTAYNSSNNYVATSTINSGPISKTQVATCVPVGGIQCVANNITVASTFQFCDNYACQNPQDFPVATLFLNRVFFMKFAITESGLSQLFIKNPQITFKSYEFQLVNTANQLTYFSNQGSIIFNLTLPIVSNNVQISVTGLLGPSNNRRMMQTTFNSSASYVATSTANSGAVVDPNVSSSISSSTSSNALIMAVFLSTIILLV